jgi:hypothetical protein
LQASCSNPYNPLTYLKAKHNENYDDPNLPSNHQPPNQARMTWDSSGLEIEASNSSLNQILHQVATVTGAKLEGLTQDQRVFGNYGPGQSSDVLLKLLDGSGYNVLMMAAVILTRRFRSF